VETESPDGSTGCGEVIEEPLATCGHLIGDLEFLKELLLREALDDGFCIREVADEMGGS
jgi:hypothetical protein